MGCSGERAFYEWPVPAPSFPQGDFWTISRAMAENGTAKSALSGATTKRNCGHEESPGRSSLKLSVGSVGLWKN